MTYNNFEKLYDMLFNIDGTTKTCDKKTKVQLITLARHMNPGIDFGDTITGTINVDNMNRLYISYKQFNNTS